MRATVTLDDEKVADAKVSTGIDDTASLMREALNALIEREAARQLIQMAGRAPDMTSIPRRRSDSGSE